MLVGGGIGVDVGGLGVAVGGGGVGVTTQLIEATAINKITKIISIFFILFSPFHVLIILSYSHLPA